MERIVCVGFLLNKHVHALPQKVEYKKLFPSHDVLSPYYVDVGGLDLNEKEDENIYFE